MKTTQTYKIGNCLDLLSEIPDKSIDMILTDLPYGKTKNEWDKLIDLDRLWLHYQRIKKDNTIIILFGQDIFSVKLIIHNIKLYKYTLIWNKVLTSGFLNANRRPLKIHEDILIFYKNKSTYNPQKFLGKKGHSKGNKILNKNNNYGNFSVIDNTEESGNMKYPQSILNFEKPHPSICIHPTQKPLALIEYLIKTYSNEGDIIHDSCLGSGVTLEACKNTNRNCIGFELLTDWEYNYKKILYSKKSLFEE